MSLNTQRNCCLFSTLSPTQPQPRLEKGLLRPPCAGAPPVTPRGATDSGEGCGRRALSRVSSLHQPRLFAVIPGEALGVGSQQPAAPCSAWRMQKGLLSDQTRADRTRKAEAHRPGSPRRPGSASGDRRRHRRSQGYRRQPAPGSHGEVLLKTMGRGVGGQGGDQGRSRELGGV